jgi:hypothetical protein
VCSQRTTTTKTKKNGLQKMNNYTGITFVPAIRDTPDRFVVDGIPFATSFPTLEAALEARDASPAHKERVRKRAYAARHSERQRERAALNGITYNGTRTHAGRELETR